MTFASLLLLEFLLTGGESVTEELLTSKYESTDPSVINEKQLKALKEFPRLEKLYTLIEQPVSKIIQDMHEVGIFIDQTRLSQVEETLSKKRELLKEHLAKTLGDVNLNSPKQLGEALVTQLKITLPKTKTGQWSTGYDVLEPLSKIHPLIASILDFRAVDKILGTYITPLSSFVAADGRIHPTYIQTVASTGRLGCKDPNIQSTPITGEYGILVRSCYTAAPECILIGADYSQQELRILAHLSGDTKLKEAFEKNIDVHIQTASEILQIPVEQVGKAERAIGKTLNFGIVYGESAFGLARQLGKSVSECSEILRRYFETYNGVKRYFDNLLTSAMIHGRVETMMGRMRGVPGKKLSEPVKFLTGEQERILKNFPIQGSAADMTKAAMVKVTRDVLPQYPGSRLIMQIHDELIFEYASTDESQITTLQQAIVDCMRRAVKISTPIEVTSSIGQSWSELK